MNKSMMMEQKLFELGDSFSAKVGLMSAEPFSFSDEDLASQIILGSSEAFAQLVRRHSRRFYGLAYRMLQDRGDAEDVVQQAFLKYSCRPQTWNKEKNVRFISWFYRVVANLCLDHLKKKKPDLVETIPESFASEENLDEAFEMERQKKLIERAVAALPEKQRLALVLCFYEELSHQEASEVMELSLKAFQSLLMRAKENLKMNFNLKESL